MEFPVTEAVQKAVVPVKDIPGRILIYLGVAAFTVTGKMKSNSVISKTIFFISILS